MKNPFSCPLEVFPFGFLVGILLDCVCVFLEAKSRRSVSIWNWMSTAHTHPRISRFSVISLLRAPCLSSRVLLNVCSDCCNVL